MQRNKIANSISEVQTYCQGSASILINNFNKLLGEIDFRYINQFLSKSKEKGVPGFKIFQTLFMLRFLDVENVTQLMNSG